MKKENLTELVFLLDGSGSMHGLEADTIGGFNSLLDKQRGESGKAFVSTIVFNTEFRTVHDRLDISRVPALTQREYSALGGTALYDALGDAIERISLIHKYARPADVPNRTLFVITTDGMENASRRFTGEKLRALVEEKKKLGWEFLFLGANIDAAMEASKIGIGEARAVNFVSDREGTRLNYEVVCETVSDMRNARPIANDWARRIDERTREIRNR